MTKPNDILACISTKELIALYQPFVNLTEEEVHILISYCEVRQFKKGEIITCEGEVDNYVNLILRGLVMKYLMLNNHSTILQLATEKQLVTSEISFLTQTDSPVYVKALEPTILLSMHYDKMQLMLAEFSKGEELGRKVMEHLYIQKDLRKNRIKQMTVRERVLY